MKINRFHLVMLVGTVLFATSCKKEKVPNKIIDTLPVGEQQTVVPAQIAQEFFMLKRDTMNLIIRVINRFTIINATYPELSGPDGSNRFTFDLSAPAYGTAHFVAEFQDIHGANLNIRTSTSAFHHAVLTVTGSSPRFTYNEDLVITALNPLDVTGLKRLTGTATYTDGSYSINFTFEPPGPSCTFEGIVDGKVTSTGTGPNSTSAAVTLLFSSDHNANGTVAWDGQEGGLHLEDNGNGYIITNQVRIILD